MREPKEAMKMFVYGTLMKGFYNHDKALAGRDMVISPARTKGAVFHMSSRGYPAIQKGDGWVYGELVEVKDFGSVIDLMDDIEEYYGPGDPRNVYERTVCEVENLETGKMEKAYVYFYLPDDLGSDTNPVVALDHGDWRRFMEEKK